MKGIDMKKWLTGIAVSALASVFIAGPALAHVTIQPNEAIASSFSRFVVRVPNERDNASTTKVQVQFPPLAFVGFEDAPGWNRDVKMKKLDEPIEAFGEQLNEAVGTVTWSGGEIQPGEFAEFGFSAAMPEGEQDLVFKAIQTYSNGEVVRWTGPEDAETPAPHLNTVELGDIAEEGAGQLEVLHEVVHEMEELSTKVDQLEAQAGSGDQASSSEDEGGSEDSSNTGVILGSIGIGLAAIALIVALLRGRS
jgi:uncharacterized protein YcnI